LPDENTAYIKEQVFGRFRLGWVAFLEPLLSFLIENGLLPAADWLPGKRSKPL
jgi:hypothetical protein